MDSVSAVCAGNIPICLCLGPKNSGKTHLLNSLQAPGSVINVSHSVPTTGTNIFTVKLPDPTKATSSNTIGANKSRPNTSSRRSGKTMQITIMEIGGEMAPMWTNYLQNVTKILYVIDTSNLCQISAAGVLLYSLLADPRLAHTKFLLVLTKMDLAYRQMRNEALLMLQYEKLRSQIRQSIQIVETSSMNCSGHSKILEWLSMP